MTTITEVSEKIQTLFGQTADRLGRQTGFIQRERVLTGSSYAQTLVFGWMSKADSTLSELSQTAASVGTQISKQGLQERFGEKSAEFMKALLQAGISQFVEGQASGAGLLSRFEYVHVIDSTTVKLPDALAQVWASCGGDGGQAGVKISVDWELVKGRLQAELSAARQHDARTSLAQSTPPSGSLRLTDVGYFNVQRLDQLDKAGAYWIIRLKSGTTLFTTEGQAFDWVSHLQQTAADRLCVEVLVGAKRLKARLCAARLSPQATARQQAQVKLAAHKKQRPVSSTVWSLTSWAVCITNTSPELLCLDEVLVLLRLRWQIELLFKLWKSHGLLDEWRSTNPWRILTELYAKLLALFIQHWLFLLDLWRLPNRSLVLAAKLVSKFAFPLLLSLSCSSRFAACLSAFQLASFRCCMSSLRHSPHTFQLLSRSFSLA